MNTPHSNPRRKQSGVGLLEILIAILVLVFGALGFAGLQLTALRNTSDANHRAHAALIAQDTIERVIANYGQINAYKTEATWTSVSTITPGNAPPNWKKCMTSTCTPAEMASWDIEQVSWTAANSMPLGKVIVKDCEFNNLDCVVVSWGEQKPEDCTTATGINTDDGTACLVLEVAR